MTILFLILLSRTLLWYKCKLFYWIYRNFLHQNNLKKNIFHLRLSMAGAASLVVRGFARQRVDYFYLFSCGLMDIIVIVCECTRRQTWAITLPWPRFRIINREALRQLHNVLDWWVSLTAFRQQSACFFVKYPWFLQPL